MDIRNPQARDAGQQIINSPPVVLILIAVLLAIHLALTLAGEDWQISNARRNTPNRCCRVIPFLFHGMGSQSRLQLVEPRY